jgi:hypothetical protein
VQSAVSSSQSRQQRGPPQQQLALPKVSAHFVERLAHILLAHLHVHCALRHQLQRNTRDAWRETCAVLCGSQHLAEHDEKLNEVEPRLAVDGVPATRRALQRQYQRGLEAPFNFVLQQ